MCRQCAGWAGRCTAAQLPGVAVSSRSVAAEPDTCSVGHVTRYVVTRYVVTRDTLCCDTRGHGSRDEEGATQARPWPGPASRVSISRVETRERGLSDYNKHLLAFTADKRPGYQVMTRREHDSRGGHHYVISR